ncbi:uncharacterized protein LOC115449302 [Manduca sexta]|uniref:uncharacterized protein LOC115449302 n=1 Tax=Manduca sexta TaxID=7130 RepID=UPI00188FBAA8|nr:uncharacterized protein LOC115449302 [Manduca sexta]
MAHPVEPMDIDNIDSDFDNKENTFHHNNVQLCTEKGYEELDVSELNMRLRYSVTPAASPMSKSYTSYVDNRSIDSDDSLNITVNEANLTRSLNATITKNDSIVKSLKSLPLQSLPAEQSVERNASILRQLDSTVTSNNNITVTVSGTNDIDDNLSLPSSSSSAVPTPEATTPTKDIPKHDGGSPIMRGLKSVLNMFRSSQSPIPPSESDNTAPKQLTPTPTKRLSSEPRDKETKPVLASTPISTHKVREANGSKRNSPLKDSITFNDDLEKELQWKDETTILFSQEKIPIHKLFYQQKASKVDNKMSDNKMDVKENFDTTVEYMDISYNDSLIKDRTITETGQEILKNELHVANESDSEFLDCETESNVTKTVSYVVDNKTVDLIKDESIVQKTMDNLVLYEDNQEIHHIDEPKEQENVTAPIPTVNKEETIENKLFPPLIQMENINLLNKSKLDSNLYSEDNLNLTKEIDNTQKSKSEIETVLDLSEQNHDELNLDVTMTMDNPEFKNKSINNMLEVSTLESHTKSLSSLIESLDVTKSFDEEKANIEGNVNLDFTTTMNQDTSNLEISNIEMPIQGNPAQILDAVTNINATITTNDQENKTFEYSNMSEAFTLNLPENLLSSTIQNLDVTMNVDKKEEITDNKGDLVPLKDKVVDTTVDIIKDIIKEVPVATSTINPVQEIITYEASQVIDNKIALQPITVNEPAAAPADVPLPDDDDIEKDMSLSTDTSIPLTDNASTMVDRSIAETEVKMIIENAVVAVSEFNTQSSDMLLNGENINNKTDLPNPLQVQAVPNEDVAGDSININTEVCSVPECHQTHQNDSVADIEKNIDTTFNVHTSIVNENIENVQNLPDVKEHVNDIDITALGAPQSQTIDSVGNDISNEESNMDGNQLQSSNHEQDKTTQDNTQSNIEPTILSDNQMETSACEEILDKNRELTEVFLIEEKIDKLQHASDMALSYHEVQDASLLKDVSQNEHQTLSEKNNITLEEDLTNSGPMTEVNKNLSVKLENQDANTTVTVEDLKMRTDETKLIPNKELNHAIEVNMSEKHKLDENELANKTITIEVVKRTNNETEKGDVRQEDMHEKAINIVIKDEVDHSNTIDKIVKIEDIKMTDYEQKDIVIQDEKIKTNEKDETAIMEPLRLNINDELPEKPDSVTVDDEIIVSGNNSPYVSVAADLDKVSEEKPLDNFEEIENSFATVSNVPNSPPITSKGYNFNFDEIDDPFATKVKIRMSPSPEEPNKISDIKNEDKSLPKAEPIKKDINKNRRRSQPARQKLSNTKKPFNATFDSTVSIIDTENPKIKSNTEIQQTVADVKIDEKQISPLTSPIDVIASTTISADDKHTEKDSEFKNVDPIEAEMTCNVTVIEDKPSDVTMSEENKDSLESVTAISNEIKTTSSSEQSTYYSAGTSSNDSMKSRNVFNLPEIDDMNFNPFATKSKIRQSPPRDLDMDNPFTTKSKIMNSPDCSVVLHQDNGEKGANTTATIENNHVEKHLEDKMETEPMEKDSSVNISNTTCSSKATDNDVTVKEVNTEDEDTVEGPFLEAEDNNENKQSDFDGDNIDMMQFNDMPVQEHDENADGELFIDAEAFEFLLNQNKSNVVADSGKESLFLKFDPLFAKRMSSDSVVAALSRAQKRQSTPTRAPRLQRNVPPSVAGPSTMNLTYEADMNMTETTEDVNTTVSKPMMVVTPAVNPTATLRKSVTPTRSNRRSITFTSPAMAVIDRLLSLSANNSLVEQEAVPQVSREQNEAELALTQLREVLAEKEINVYNLRSESKELKDRLATLESQMKLLETESQERLKKINDLNDKLSEKTKMNKSMAVVVEEYERTIASLIAETEQDKKRHAEERIALMNERDEQTAHLASMEVSFNDLHSKYEKSKQVIMNYKANEESYKQSLKEFEENVSKMQKNYELLKQHATSKLNHANDELQKINRSHEAEVLKLNAMIKRKELHITSLEETLAQKTKANEELTAICDELINKVG